jgi:hypothetical protein
VATAREKALKIQGTFTVESLRKHAEDAAAGDDKDKARRFWTWLSEIPGDPGKDALKRRDEVGTDRDPGPTNPKPRGEGKPLQSLDAR